MFCPEVLSVCMKLFALSIHYYHQYSVSSQFAEAGLGIRSEVTARPCFKPVIRYLVNSRAEFELLTKAGVVQNCKCCSCPGFEADGSGRGACFNWMKFCM